MALLERNSGPNGAFLAHQSLLHVDYGDVVNSQGIQMVSVACRQSKRLNFRGCARRDATQRIGAGVLARRFHNMTTPLYYVV